jgi:predicted phage-related endonuclease
MKILKLIQGTPEWAAHRAHHFNASDAPAMMGCSDNQTRTELMTALHTGLQREHSDYVQERILNPGHRFEELARPLAENIIGSDLYPVTGSDDVDGLPLSASFDGLTMDRRTAFEHKRLNATLIETMTPECTGAMLPLKYQVQMEQQCIVSGCQRVLFMASDWSADGNLIEERHCWYEPNPALAAEILAGWKQLQAEMPTFTPHAPTVKPVGKTMETLPALHIAVTGAVTASNLGDFKAHALAVFDGINRTLTTDQEFADAEAAVKWCGEVETRLKAAKDHALSQASDIYTLLSTLDEVSEEARKVRLELGKLVEQRKTAIRTEIVAKAAEGYRTHIAQLNQNLGRQILPGPLTPPDFATAIKGKRSIDSLKNAADTELAKAKTQANLLAERVTSNLQTLSAQTEYASLFPDTATLALKLPDDLDAIIQSRIATHQANEAARKAKDAQAQPPVAPTSAAQDEAHKASVDLTSPLAVQAMASAVLAQVAEDSKTLKLGEITQRLGLPMTADMLSQLGFSPVGTERAAKLYRESDFVRICDALIVHIQRAKTVAAATQAQPA